MKDFIKFKITLEAQGYNNVVLAEEGWLIVATKNSEVCLFNEKLERIPLSYNVRIEKKNDNTYKIIFLPYETEYEIVD